MRAAGDAGSGWQGVISEGLPCSRGRIVNGHTSSCQPTTTWPGRSCCPLQVAWPPSGSRCSALAPPRGHKHACWRLPALCPRATLCSTAVHLWLRCTEQAARPLQGRQAPAASQGRLHSSHATQVLHLACWGLPVVLPQQVPPADRTVTSCEVAVRRTGGASVTGQAGASVPTVGPAA